MPWQRASWRCRRRPSKRWPAAGRIYSRAHAHNTVTLPSHLNILTGPHPYQHGVRDNAGFVLPASVPTLADLLRGEAATPPALLSARSPSTAAWGVARLRGLRPAARRAKRAARRRFRGGRTASPGNGQAGARLVAAERGKNDSCGCTSSIRTPPTTPPSPGARFTRTSPTAARSPPPTTSWRRCSRARPRAGAAGDHRRPRRRPRRAR